MVATLLSQVPSLPTIVGHKKVDKLQQKAILITLLDKILSPVHHRGHKKNEDKLPYRAIVVTLPNQVLSSARRSGLQEHKQIAAKTLQIQVPFSAHYSGSREELIQGAVKDNCDYTAKPSASSAHHCGSQEHRQVAAKITLRVQVLFFTHHSGSQEHGY